MQETLSIKVPKAQKTRLRALASKRGTTLTRLMIEALEALAREGATAAPTSCYELTRDLFEKPENLGASPEGDRSTNKGRLKAFGAKGGK